MGEAVTQMDQVTQQNAAMVEEMAAAAGSLSSKAQELVQTVNVFQLEGASGAASRRVPSPVRRSAPAPQALGMGSGLPKLASAA